MHSVFDSNKWTPTLPTLHLEGALHQGHEWQHRQYPRRQPGHNGEWGLAPACLTCHKHISSKDGPFSWGCGAEAGATIHLSSSLRIFSSCNKSCVPGWRVSNLQIALVSDAAAAPADVHCLTSPGSPSWQSVVKSRKRLSLPLYDLFGIGRDVIPLSNFSPLAEIPPEPVLSPIPPPAGTAELVHPAIRKRSARPSFTSSLASLSPSSAPPPGANVAVCQSCRTLNTCCTQSQLQWPLLIHHSGKLFVISSVLLLLVWTDGVPSRTLPSTLALCSLALSWTVRVLLVLVVLVWSSQLFLSGFLLGSLKGSVHYQHPLKVHTATTSSQFKPLL